MPKQVASGAKMMCSFGSALSELVVLPKNKVIGEGQPAANILDHVPGVNVQPFGQCLSPNNPTVAAATAAAFGVLTPQQCVPQTTAAWAPGAATVNIANARALDNVSTCKCLWGGEVSFVNAGTVKTMIP